MYAYFDIGGTKTRVAVSEDGKVLGEPEKFDTPNDFDDLITLIADTAQKQAGGKPILAAGGGIASPLSSAGRIIVAPHIPKIWIGRSVAEELGAKLNAQVFINNDSAIVGLGEAHHGAGKGDDIMAYITVSTGLGGARFVHGKLDVSAYGFEPGHQIIDFDKSACPECMRGTAEGYCCGTATKHRFNKEPYDIEQNSEVWEQIAQWMAYVLNNTIVHWSPHSVVLGGSMIVGDPAIPVDRIEHHLQKIFRSFNEVPTLKKAALGDFGGLYGAMVFVAQQLEKEGGEEETVA